MQVTEIWRYPVKSLGGERLDRAEVGPDGIVGDRSWGLRDRDTGLVLTARREPQLLFLSATHVDGGRPRVSGPDGEPLPDDDALGAVLGRPVELVAASDGPGTFENPMNVDDETDWVRWESAGRTFHDGRSTISFVSVAALADWDHRRFRINVIVDGDGDVPLDGHVSLGSARVAIRKPIERCVMVSRAQPGIERDLQVLKTIIAERDNRLGVGGVIVHDGVIAVGDELTVG